MQFSSPHTSKKVFLACHAGLACQACLTCHAGLDPASIFLQSWTPDQVRGDTEAMDPGSSPG